MWLSWARARRGDWATHQRIQLALGGTLAVVVVLFETDMRMAGGIFELTRGSAYEGTVLLTASIWIHTALSISTSVLWIVLTIASLRRFASPPRPAPFSPRHRPWGRIGMIAMALTGITGIELCVVGFAL